MSTETAQPAEAVLFTSYTLAIVTLQASAIKALRSKDQDMHDACSAEIDKMQLRRAELLEQVENRIGGS